MKLKNLKTKTLGRNIFYYKSIDSTQKEIWRRYEENNILNGTLIYCDKQTASIGTHGKVWYTEENNIAFSFYIDLDCNISKLKGITIKIASIVVDILERKYNVRVNIKEPNDIYCNGKKMGGILTQTKVIKDRVKNIVIGIGINTEQKKFAHEIEDIATSIINEFNVHVNTQEFIAEFCNEFEKEIEERGMTK